MVTLPCAAAMALTQLTTLRKSSKRNVNTCVGVYGGNKYAMGKESDATSALAKEHTAAVLCSEPSLNGKTRKGRNTQSSSVFKFRP